MKRLDDYLELPYTITIVPDADEEGNTGYVAEVAELPGCISQGATIEEAAAGWLSVALEDSIEIPEPRDPASHSGRLLLRIPRSLHAELARQAELEGVSLNQFLATALAGAIGWRHARDVAA